MLDNLRSLCSRKRGHTIETIKEKYGLTYPFLVRKLSTIKKEEGCKVLPVGTIVEIEDTHSKGGYLGYVDGQPYRVVDSSTWEVV